MFEKSWVVVGCGLLLACGGEAPPAKAPEPVSPPMPEVAAAPLVARTPSPEVSKYWVVREPQPFTMYADTATLLHSELMSGLLPAVMEQAGDAVKGPERACLTALVDHAQELILAAGERSGLAVLSLGTEGVKAARTACVGSVLPVERATVKGAEEAYSVGDGDVIAVLPSVVLYGSQSFVEAALDPAAKPAAVPLHFKLSSEQQLAFRFDMPGKNVSASGAAGTSKEHFLITGQVQLPSEAAAEEVDKKIAMGRSQAGAFMQSMGGAGLGRLLNALEVKRRGNGFDVRFDLRGSPQQQANDLGTLAALGVSGARKYMANAKAAEAKATLKQITKLYQATLNEADSAKPKKPKKLVSMPAVPASVPRGAKYQSSADDWKGWAPIQFKLDGPQYFQYEVVAAKDGKSAEILARGDLDGDGQASLYRLKIQLDPKTGQITAQGLDETDPFE
jgi:hypothetical protein